METDFTARMYTPEDAVMVQSWWFAHGEGQFPFPLLPPVGVVVEFGSEPLVACWLYMAVGVGVCWLEYPVSRPGLGMTAARAAFGCAVGALEAIARTHDYGVMIAHTLPPIARVMRGFGFTPEERRKVTIIKEVPHGS